MNLLSIIVAVALIYLLIIFCVMLITKSSVIEARGKVNDFIKEVFLTETPQPQQAQWTYGIGIGIDANGCLCPDIVESEFGCLSKIFTDYYFCNAWEEKNHMVYVFAVDEPIVEMTDEQLYKLCLKRCNSAVHRSINRTNLYGGCIMGTLAAIKIVNNQLWIRVAENDIGKSENDVFVRRMKLSLKRQARVANTASIQESWSE